jgi:hypothetical protein
MIRRQKCTATRFKNFSSDIQIFDAKLCSRRAERKKFCAASQTLTRNIFER